MSIFKKMVENDMDNVVFNLNELADLHSLDGRQISAIVDDARLEEMKAKPKYADGYNTATKLIYVKAKDLPGKPAQGAHIELDNKIYIVQSVTGQHIWEIVLEANR